MSKGTFSVRQLGICVHCSQEFLKKQDKQKYCCEKCRNVYRGRKYLAENLEKELVRKRLYMKRQKEEQPEHVKAVNNRATYKYKDKTRFGGKREEILRLHNNRCDRCSATQGLHIHHIDGVSYWNSPKPNNSFDNLMVLCGSCHHKLHHKQRKLGRTINSPIYV